MPRGSTALLLLVLAGCSNHRDLPEGEVRALLTGARVTGTRDGQAFERHYDETTFTQTGTKPGEADWTLYSGKHCATWKDEGRVRCNHLVTDQRGTYWLERRTNSQEAPDPNRDGTPGTRLVENRVVVETFATIEDARTGADRRRVEPVHLVYWKPLLAASGVGMFLLVFVMPSKKKEEDAPPPSERRIR
jgi:hypothetical protein